MKTLIFRTSFMAHIRRLLEDAGKEHPGLSADFVLRPGEEQSVLSLSDIGAFYHYALPGSYSAEGMKGLFAEINRAGYDAVYMPHGDEELPSYFNLVRIIAGLRASSKYLYGTDRKLVRVGRFLLVRLYARYFRALAVSYVKGAALVAAGALKRFLPGKGCVLVYTNNNTGTQLLLMPYLDKLRSRYAGRKIAVAAAPSTLPFLLTRGAGDVLIDAGRGARWSVFFRKTGVFINMMHKKEMMSLDLLRLSGAVESVSFNFFPGKFSKEAVLDPAARDMYDMYNGLFSLIGIGVKSGERGKKPEKSGNKLIGIYPGAGRPEKMWPAEKFVEAAEKIIERHPGPKPVIIFGSGETGDFKNHFKTKLGGRCFYRDCPDLETLCGEISGLGLLLTNDTAAAHIAAAQGKPAVVIRGPGAERYLAGKSGIYPVSVPVPCRPCNPYLLPCSSRECMERISISAVMENFERAYSAL